MMAGVRPHHNEVLAAHRSPSAVATNFQVCLPRYLIDHRDRRLDVRRPTIAATATHSIEKLYDHHDMLYLTVSAPVRTLVTGRR
jgi:hypothetical protein